MSKLEIINAAFEEHNKTMNFQGSQKKIAFHFFNAGFWKGWGIGIEEGIKHHSDLRDKIELGE